MTPRTGDPMPAEQRRSVLCAAAIDVIAELGIGGLRTREVARRAGVTHATLHAYFPRKEDLIKAALTATLQQCGLARPPFGGPGGGAPIEDLRAALIALYRRAGQDGTSFRVLQEFARYAAAGSEMEEMLLDCRQGWRGYLAGLMEPAIRAGQLRSDVLPGEMADLFIALAHGIAVDFGGPAPCPPEYALYTDRMLRLLVRTD